jgi:hypothetical protein
MLCKLLTPMLVSGADADGATVESTVEDSSERFIGASVVTTLYDTSECETRDEERVCSI